MATFSSILAWRIPMDRGAWQAAVHGVTELDTTEWLSTAQVQGSIWEGYFAPGKWRIWNNKRLWVHHAKSWLTGKDFDAGRDWGQEEKGMTEDEMAGWHHWLNGSKSEWTPGVGDGQGGLVCCDSWGRKGSDTTEWLNWTELKVSQTLKYLVLTALLSVTLHTLITWTTNKRFYHWGKVA